ncbi:MAG: aminotransferase class III-fold pyridoxal phosphate-dependent enzyme, partial [Bacteriovoracaceae bacterium]|nr:aminotransferase class III-fold pyridoxal phosphate-dependent enzyme [Bacteriovoracaceae bacterium]
MKSQTELFERSKQLVPGGVHSPVRSFKGLDSTPRFMAKGEGAKIWDTDGKDYIDFCMSFGPLILGHRNPAVEEELKSALERGWSYGACEPYSLELLEFLLERLPFVDQMRFVNSGTEAVMTALR